MDVIFCRNVLMYFTPDHQRRVVAALHRCLVDGGYLFVHPAEASASLFPMFAMENMGGVILYRKTSQPTRVESWPGLGSPVPAPAVPVRQPALIAAPRPPLPVVPVASAPPITPITASPGEAPLALARAYANQGRLEEALRSCEDVIAAERANPAAHFLYATICDELGRLEEAITALGTVLYLDQDFILAHHALGSLYKRLGKQKESRRHVAVALELLSARSRDEIVPESEGMTCGRLVESVRAMTGA
jgi:chemotaxis protein methyltransferase CheR